jgi:hypothetical protein
MREAEAEWQSVLRVRSSKISEGAHPIMRSCQTLWKVNLDLVWSPPAERCVGNTMAFESSAFRWCNFSMVLGLVGWVIGQMEGMG